MKPIARIRLVSQARSVQIVKCALCKVEGEATLHRSRVAGALEAKWLRPPSGWWLLLECGDMHVRCPKCLGGG